MGNLLGSKSEEVRILMIGLQGAGKTTAMYKLKLGEEVTVRPTVGFTTETVQYNGYRFVLWDLSGSDKNRPMWKHYFRGTDALILVVDSTDHYRVLESKQDLWTTLKEKELRNSVFLVMANKQDLPEAASVEEVSRELEVDQIRDRPIHVQGTSAKSGEGLHESLNWVLTTLAERQPRRFPTKQSRT